MFEGADRAIWRSEATAAFDASFRPASERVASRWRSIARAYHDGHPVPPIRRDRIDGGYYVLDGRHREEAAAELERCHPQAAIA